MGRTRTRTCVDSKQDVIYYCTSTLLPKWTDIKMKCKQNNNGLANGAFARAHILLWWAGGHEE